MPYYWKSMKRLIDTPHLLIAGTTGSGKSVLLNSIIYSAMSDAPLFFFIDLKRVEMSRYKRMCSTLGYAEEPEDVPRVLDRVIGIMESRYKTMKGVQSSDPTIYVVVDELADLVYSCKKLGALERLTKIGRLGRAANIHLICATQDPSKKTLSAQIMQNFTSRVALRCFSGIESNQIIGVRGAETLPEYGFGLVRDSHGIHKIEIPLTPEEDISSLVRQFTGLKWIFNKLKLAITGI